jgi:glutathione reductase (NADPH)
LRGCDPKKVLVGAADALAWANRMDGKGLNASNVSMNWQDLMRFKRTFTEPFPAKLEESFQKAGIQTFHGAAHFIEAQSVRVGDEILKAKHVVIATGAKPARLSFPGGDLAITSDDFLDLDSLPARVAFIGGGYISFEFAHIAVRAGAHVTIVHRGPDPLERFDSDLVQRLVGNTRAAGIEVRLNHEVIAIERTASGYRIRAKSPEGETAIEADLPVHAAGRVPNLDDLDLDKAGVEYGKNGVRVNEYLQSVSNPAVYAIGDSAVKKDGPPLTPVASYDGALAAENLLHGNIRRSDYRAVPSVVFTIPPLAMVGLTEAEATRRGMRFRGELMDTSAWYSTRRVGESGTAAKVLIEESTGMIIGAHLLGPAAEETINLFALAMRHGLTAAAVKESIYAYPTHGSDLKYML